MSNPINRYRITKFNDWGEVDCRERQRRESVERKSQRIAHTLRDRQLHDEEGSEYPRKKKDSECSTQEKNRNKCTHEHKHAYAH